AASPHGPRAPSSLAGGLAAPALFAAWLPRWRRGALAPLGLAATAAPSGRMNDAHRRPPVRRGRPMGGAGQERHGRRGAPHERRWWRGRRIRGADAVAVLLFRRFEESNACFLTGPLAELCCAPAAVRSGPAALAEYLGLEGYEHTRHVGLLKSQAQWWSPQTASLHLARQLALAKAAVRAAINQSQVDLGPRAGGFGCNSC
ncbi:unnamed protein product, partial [Prorocentrum cordatum]